MSTPLQDGWTADVVRILIDAVDRALFELHVGLPAEVQAYDASTQTADVQPTIKRYYWSDADEPVIEEHVLPLLRGVPVWFPAGAGWVVHFPLQVGDTCYLGFAERALGAWGEAAPGTLVEPESTRRHDLSDAVVFPGLRRRKDPIQNLSPTNLRIGREDGTTVLEMSPDGAVTLLAAQAVELGGVGGSAVGRVGDAIVIDDPAFLAWVQAIASATGLRVPIPFEGASISGRIVAGASKVRAT